MRKTLKIVAIGVVTAAGIATGAAAQQGNAQQQQMMGQGNMSNMPGMMNIMHDPKMREQMTAMMGDCHKMMTQMSSMHDGQKKATR